MENTDQRKMLPSNVHLTLRDPLVTVLCENSSLTRTQLETLLLDVLPQEIGLSDITFAEKALYRQNRPISRGAFNRSLKQARINIIRSLYTVLLLEYLGLASPDSLAHYLELSSELKSYTEAYQQLWQQSPDHAERVLTEIRARLSDALKEAAKPLALKRRV